MSKDLTATDFVRMALIHSALSVEARDIEQRGESTLFDIATETGRDRLSDLLERIEWARTSKKLEAEVAQLRADGQRLRELVRDAVGSNLRHDADCSSENPCSDWCAEAWAILAVGDAP